MYAYNVNAYFEHAETTLRTNHAEIAIQEFSEYVSDGLHCNIIDGTTGEVLAIANAPDHKDYYTAEISLMMIGHMAKKIWGEG